MPVSPARRIAFSILHRVDSDHAFSTDLLHALPAMGRLDKRDQALAHQIVLGCLRWQGELDELIEQSARRPVAKLDAEVRIALRMGCYQLRHLQRIPPRAAVSESVELVKVARKRSAASFVNAVLRGLRQGPITERSREAAHLSWMVERWRRIYGTELTARILQANLETPTVYLRLHGRYSIDETVRLLKQQGVETEPAGEPSCRRVVRGNPAETACYRQGRLRIQDISSQKVVPLLDLQPGLRFLDLCAAPGGKTDQAVELLGSPKGAVAADRRLPRLLTMRRLGAVSPDLLVLDATKPLPFLGSFDRILVDAPCSGTGTLARNPEIKWRLRPEDLPRLATRQRQILQNALSVLSPKGLVVYSTCSLEPEENREVVDAVLAERTRFRVHAYLERIPGRDPGDGFFACAITRSEGFPTRMQTRISLGKQMIE